MCAVKLVHQGSFTGRYRSYGTYKGVRNGSYRGEYAQNVPQKPSTALSIPQELERDAKGLLNL
jgi:hypothetical protein